MNTNQNPDCSVTIPDAPYVVESGNGEIFSGNTATEIVEQMKVGSNAKDLNGYMRQIAANIDQFSGDKVRTNTPENFLIDLANAKSIVLHCNGALELYCNGARTGARNEQED